MDLLRRDSSDSYDSIPEVRLILVGNMSCGKTATADTLLNESSSTSTPDSSRRSEVRHAVSEGRRLKIVETPRWYWNGKHIDASVQRETERALSLLAPGPHAFLILVPVGQFTQMDGRIPSELERVFGRGALQHTLVLLTCGDYLIGREHEQYLRLDESGLSTMVNECGGRWHVINNRRPGDRQQAISLLEKVERLTESTGGCYLPSGMLSEKEHELQRRYSLQERGLPHQDHSPLTQTTWSKEETWEDLGRRGKFRVRSMGPTTGRVVSHHLANGLHSQPWYDDSPVGLKHKYSSFKLSKEGAILSQMSETEQSGRDQNNQSFINTIHYQISTADDTSSAPPSLPSSYSTSSNAFSSLPSASFSSSSLTDFSTSSSNKISSSPLTTFASSSSTKFSSYSPASLPSSTTNTSFSTSSNVLPSSNTLSSYFSHSNTSFTSSSTTVSSSSPTTNASSFLSSSTAFSSSSPKTNTSFSSSSTVFPSSSPKTNASFSSSSTAFPSSSPQTNTSSSSSSTAFSSSFSQSTNVSSFSSSSTALPSSSPKTNASFASSSTAFPFSSPQTNTSFSSSSTAFSSSFSPSTNVSSFSSSSTAFPSSSPKTNTSFSSSSSPKTNASFSSSSTAFSSSSPSTNASTSSSSTVFSSSSPSTNASFSSSFTDIPSRPIATSSSSFFSSSLSSSASSDELRLVLLGRSGSGKSAAGNAILGQDNFKLRRDDATGATTQSCVKGTSVIGKKQVAVVDTPDWFWPSCPPEELASHLSSCMDLCAPGPHAFLLCVPVTLPGRSNLHDLGSIKNSFGSDAILKHTLVLFTHSDMLKDENVEGYIAAKRPELLELVEKCGDRYHVLKQGRNKGNIEELMEKLEQLVKERGGSHYIYLGQDEVDRERMQLQRGRGGEDDVDRAVSATLHSLREEEEVEQEEKNAKPVESTTSTITSVLSSVLRFVGQMVVKGAKQVPKLVAGGAVLGGVLGLYVGGPVGGAVGATAGSVATEYGRRKYNKPKTD